MVDRSSHLGMMPCLFNLRLKQLRCVLLYSCDFVPRPFPDDRGYDAR
jgi:hypothetical protein